MSGISAEMQVAKNYVGCWRCDSLLPLLISDVHGKMYPHGGRRGRGKRRGRGRRGRGH